MNLNRITARALVGSALLTAAPSSWAARSQAGAGQPRVIHVSSVAPEKNAQLSTLVAEIRSDADAFVFLSGGALDRCRPCTRNSAARHDAG
jgi:hypothetical protein